MTAYIDARDRIPNTVYFSLLLILALCSTNSGSRAYTQSVRVETDACVYATPRAAGTGTHSFRVILLSKNTQMLLKEPHWKTPTKKYVVPTIVDVAMAQYITHLCNGNVRMRRKSIPKDNLSVMIERE